jgi:hypothetical protein
VALHPAVDRQPSDLGVEKRWSDAFRDTDLDPLLREAGVGRVVIVGAQTEYCVDGVTIQVLHVAEVSLTWLLGYQPTASMYRAAAKMSPESWSARDAHAIAEAVASGTLVRDIGLHDPEGVARDSLMLSAGTQAVSQAGMASYRESAFVPRPPWRALCDSDRRALLVDEPPVHDRLASHAGACARRHIGSLRRDPRLPRGSGDDLDTSRMA